MRPSVRLIAIVLALSFLTTLIAVVRPDWLLILGLIWSAFGFLILADIYISPTRKSLNVQVDLPNRAFVGRSVDAKIQVIAAAGALPQDIQTRLDLSDEIELAEPIEVFGGEDRHSFDAQLIPKKRGTFSFQNISFLWRSKLTFFEMIADFKQQLELKVLPDTHPVTSGLIHTQILPMLDGIKNFNTKGEGSEFHQLKEFTQGMDIRSIDWKRSGKNLNLIAREVRAERNHQIIACVDSGHLMCQHMGGVSRLDLALNASLALCWAGGLGGDQVGFYEFSAQPGSFLAARPGREAFPIIRAKAADVEYSQFETNHTWGLTHLGTQLKRRSLVIVFSEFADLTSAELLMENLSILRKQHLVLYIMLEDLQLDQIIEAKDVDIKHIAASVSAARIKAERLEVVERLRRMGVLVLNSKPGELTTDLISKYMDIKMEELI